MFGPDGKAITQALLNSADQLFQYETARLYGPVVMMPRFTGEAVQRLVIGKREHLLPPQTTVTINFAALHTHPDYWGTDALIFRPDRWIVASGKEKGEGQLHQPPAGAYVPWNAGPRVCKLTLLTLWDLCEMSIAQSRPLT